MCALLQIEAICIKIFFNSVKVIQLLYGIQGSEPLSLKLLFNCSISDLVYGRGWLAFQVVKNLHVSLVSAPKTIWRLISKKSLFRKWAVVIVSCFSDRDYFSFTIYWLQTQLSYASIISIVCFVLYINQTDILKLLWLVWNIFVLYGVVNPLKFISWDKWCPWLLRSTEKTFGPEKNANFLAWIFYVFKCRHCVIGACCRRYTFNVLFCIF